MVFAKIANGGFQEIQISTGPETENPNPSCPVEMLWQGTSIRPTTARHQFLWIRATVEPFGQTYLRSLEVVEE